MNKFIAFFYLNPYHSKRGLEDRSCFTLPLQGAGGLIVPSPKTGTCNQLVDQRFP